VQADYKTKSCLTVFVSSLLRCADLSSDVDSGRVFLPSNVSPEADSKTKRYIHMY